MFRVPLGLAYANALSVMVGLVPTIHVLTTSELAAAAERLARHQLGKTWMVATRATMTGEAGGIGSCRRVSALPS